MLGDIKEKYGSSCGQPPTVDKCSTLSSCQLNREVPRMYGHAEFVEEGGVITHLGYNLRGTNR